MLTPLAKRLNTEIKAKNEIADYVNHNELKYEELKKYVKKVMRKYKIRGPDVVENTIDELVNEEMVNMNVGINTEYFGKLETPEYIDDTIKYKMVLNDAKRHLENKFKDREVDKKELFKEIAHYVKKEQNIPRKRRDSIVTHIYFDTLPYLRVKREKNYEF